MSQANLVLASRSFLIDFVDARQFDPDNDSETLFVEDMVRDGGVFAMIAAGISMVLEEIDDDTGSVINSIPFDVQTIEDLPFGDDLLSGRDIYLEKNEAQVLKNKLGLGETGIKSRLRQRLALDDSPYTVHTGRELLMMLQGKKPMAAFIAAQIENLGPAVYFNQSFDKYVESGAINFRQRTLIREKTNRGKNPIKVDYLVYTIPGEEWRAEAYFLLMKMMDEIGWCKHFEHMEGTLLGYTLEENALHLKMKYGIADDQ